MRFQCVSPLLCTVGTVTAIRNTLRPTLGSVFERLGIEHVGVRGVRGLDQRRIGGHGDRLLERADLERDVERDERLRRDADAAALEGLEPRDARLDRVVAGVDAPETSTRPTRW